jgi:hypothetical protein
MHVDTCLTCVKQFNRFSVCFCCCSDVRLRAQLAAIEAKAESDHNTSFQEACDLLLARLAHIEALEPASAQVRDVSRSLLRIKFACRCMYTRLLAFEA